MSRKNEQTGRSCTAVCRHCQKFIPRDPLTDLLTVTLRYPIRHLYALLWRAGILDIGV